MTASPDVVDLDLVRAVPASLRSFTARRWVRPEFDTIEDAREAALDAGASLLADSWRRRAPLTGLSQAVAASSYPEAPCRALHENDQVAVLVGLLAGDLVAADLAGVSNESFEGEGRRALFSIFVACSEIGARIDESVVAHIVTAWEREGVLQRSERDLEVVAREWVTISAITRLWVARAAEGSVGAKAER